MILMSRESIIRFAYYYAIPTVVQYYHYSMHSIYIPINFCIGTNLTYYNMYTQQLFSTSDGSKIISLGSLAFDEMWKIYNTSVH